MMGSSSRRIKHDIKCNVLLNRYLCNDEGGVVSETNYMCVLVQMEDYNINMNWIMY